MGVGLPGQQFVDEALLIAALEERRPPGESALVADGGRRNGPQGFAAGASRAVGGQDLHVVGEGEQAVAEAGEEVAGTGEAGIGAAGRLVEEVRASGVTDEDEVAGEHEPRCVGLGTVGDEERQVLGSVAGGVRGAQGDVAEGDLVTVAQAHRVVEARPVGPVGSAFVGDVHRRAGGCGEFAGAGEIVGVDVGLGDGGDRQSVAVGEVAVDRDVPAGIDDDRLPAGLAGYDVAGMGEVGVEDAFEEHGSLLSVVDGCLVCRRVSGRRGGRRSRAWPLGPHPLRPGCACRCTTGRPGPCSSPTGCVARILPTWFFRTLGTSLLDT